MLFLYIVVVAYAEMFTFEKCICEVEKRPPLCNITTKYYCSRELKAKCWKKTCAEMQSEWNETKNLFKNEICMQVTCIFL